MRGGNARDVVEGLKVKIAEIQDKGLLPAGWRIVPFYDRIELISAALTTVYKALGEGILLVVIVLFVFLGDTRSALIVAATLIATTVSSSLAHRRLAIPERVRLHSSEESIRSTISAWGTIRTGR